MTIVTSRGDPRKLYQQNWNYAKWVRHREMAILHDLRGVSEWDCLVPSNGQTEQCQCQWARERLKGEEKSMGFSVKWGYNPTTPIPLGCQIVSQRNGPLQLFVNIRLTIMHHRLIVHSIALSINLVHCHIQHEDDSTSIVNDKKCFHSEEKLNLFADDKSWWGFLCQLLQKLKLSPHKLKMDASFSHRDVPLSQFLDFLLSEFHSTFHHPTCLFRIVWK